MTDAKAFADTNIVLRLLLSQVGLHQEAKALIQKMLDEGYTLWINRQVIREFLVQVTRPQADRGVFTSEEIEAWLEEMHLLFFVLDETEQVTRQLRQLMREFPVGGKQIHDANIVATMLANGITTLLTQNIADMKRFESKITLIPLQPDPQDTP